MDAFEGATHALGHGAGEHGLGHAGNILEQDVPLGEQGRHGEDHLVGFTDDDALNVGHDQLRNFAEAGRGINVFGGRGDHEFDLFLRLASLAGQENAFATFRTGELLADQPVGNLKTMTAVLTDSVGHKSMDSSGAGVDSIQATTRRRDKTFMA